MRAITIVMLVVAGCAPSFVKRGGEFWSYKLNKGQSVNYENSSSVKTTIEVNGKIQETQTKIYLRTNQLVVDVDTLIDLSIAIDSVTVQTSVNGQPTAAPSPGVLKGKTWSLLMDSIGTVVAAHGLEDVELYGERGGDVVLKYQQYFNFLPGHFLKPGSRWQKLSADDADTTVSHFTFGGFEKKDGRRCARIDVQCEAREKRSGEQMGGTVTLDINGKGRGQIFFAVEEGLLVSYQMHLSMEGMSVISGPMLSQPMKLPLYIDQNEMMRLVP